MKPKPVLLGAERQLFGILHPADAPRRTAVIVLNSGLLHNVGPFRLHVDLANRLSAAGFVTLRLDQSGKGESAARPGKSREETLLEDYDDAMAYLRGLDIEQTALIGLCSGADDELYIAAERGSVRGLVMLDGYAPKGPGYTLVHYGTRLFRPGAWTRRIGRLLCAPKRAAGVDTTLIDIRDWKAPAEMVSGIASFLSGGGKLLAVYTAGVSEYYNHANQLARSLTTTAGLKEVYLPEVDHTYSRSAHRSAVVRDVTEWLRAEFE